ncbi:MAG: flagellar hook-associated protein FlgK [Deltaproteobacteria bacterium HGW-Deltaproteobacteria-14]|jgi:flagellar hook-associated protein 1 FlgK|nr:MAG: flagellar hook-associated protein FlgK [Deltaproteobacteria bacterium HGW-Deltaproteobacteria-14]
MTTLQHILSIANSGLQSSQTLVASASRNIANANTPGYARETVPLSAQLGGLGVVTGFPVASRNALLEQGVVATAARLGFYQSQSNQLQSLEIAFNDLDGTGLGISMRGFEAAMSAVAANPASMADRGQALQSALSLATTFASTRDTVSRTASDAHEQASAVAQEINSLAQQVAQLNGRIRSARPGEERNSLISQRAAVIDAMSGSIGVDTVARSDGTVSLVTASGRALVESTFPATIAVTLSAPPASTVAVSFAQADGSYAASNAPLGGELGGLVEFHNEVAAPALERIDELAYSFMDAFNQAHRAGFNLNGGTGYDFFELPTTVTGAASGMALSRDVDGHPENIGAAADASGVPGDNTNALVLKGILGQEGVLADGSSVIGAYETLGASVSNTLVRAQSGASLEQGSLDQLQNLLASESGVSIDEELIRVTQANAALSASNTILQQLQSMTDTILNMVG